MDFTRGFTGLYLPNSSVTATNDNRIFLVLTSHSTAYPCTYGTSCGGVTCTLLVLCFLLQGFVRERTCTFPNDAIQATFRFELSNSRLCEFTGLTFGVLLGRYNQKLGSLDQSANASRILLESRHCGIQCLSTFSH